MKQAIKLAIEWIEKQPEETPHSKYDVDTRYVVLRELEAALAQPEQKFVAWEQFYPDIGKPQIAFNSEGVWYVAPQRTWIGLTDEDRYEFAAAQYGWEDLLIAAEAKLKEKNT